MLFNISSDPINDPNRLYLQNAYHSHHLVETKRLKLVETMMKKEFELKLDNELAKKLHDSGVTKEHPVANSCTGCYRETRLGTVMGANRSERTYNISWEEAELSDSSLIRRPLPDLPDCVWSHIRGFLGNEAVEREDTMDVDDHTYAGSRVDKHRYWFEDLEGYFWNKPRNKNDSKHMLFIRGASTNVKPVMIYRSQEHMKGQLGMMHVSDSSPRRKLYWFPLDDVTSRRQLDPYSMAKRPDYDTLVYEDLVKPAYYVCLICINIVCLFVYSFVSPTVVNTMECCYGLESLLKCLFTKFENLVNLQN